MSLSNYEVERFHGPGNAKYVLDFIKKELPPLAWNMIAMKNMQYIVKANLKAIAIKETDEFSDELLAAINSTIENDYNSSLPL